MQRHGRTGLAYAIVVFILTIIIGSAMIAIFNQPVNGFLDAANANSETAAAAEGQGYVRAAWTWFPLFGLIMAAVLVISSAVFQSNRGGL